MSQNLSLIILMLFSLLSTWDGIYLHLFKYKLHEHEESKREHLLHTFRASLFFLILLFIYYFQSSGFWLYLGIFFIVVDYIVESLDMIIEGQSRKNIGGLSDFEYWLHGTLIMLRSLSLGLWLSSFTSERFYWNQTSIKITMTGWNLFLLEQILISTLAVVGIHLVLIFKPKLMSTFRLTCCSS